MIRASRELAISRLLLFADLSRTMMSTTMSRPESCPSGHSFIHLRGVRALDLIQPPETERFPKRRLLSFELIQLQRMLSFPRYHHINHTHIHTLTIVWHFPWLIMCYAEGNVVEGFFRPGLWTCKWRYPLKRCYTDQKPASIHSPQHWSVNLDNDDMDATGAEGLTHWRSHTDSATYLLIYLST